MSDLSNNLDRLFSWLESIGLSPPSRDVRILEVGTGFPQMGPPSDSGEFLVLLLEFRSRALRERRQDQVKIIDQLIGGIAKEGARRARLRVSRDQLLRPLDYEPRFNELLDAGLSWVNISCYGVYDGFLIVAIEVPFVRESAHGTGITTPVNLSGPSASVVSSGWSVDELLVVE